MQTTCGLKWTDTFISFDNIEEPRTTDILGVTFQAPESYVPSFYITSWEEDPQMAALIPKVMEITPKNSLSNIYAKYDELQYAYNPSYASFQYDFKVRSFGKTSYSIVISGSLNEPKKQLLKAVCYMISSTPETLYNVIVHDHNESAFLTSYEEKHFGDFSIHAVTNLGISSVLPSAVYFVTHNERNITKSIPKTSKQTNAPSRYELKFEVELEHLDNLVDGKLYLRMNDIMYFEKTSGYKNTDYYFESSNPDVLEATMGGSKYWLEGKKKGTAILTTKKIQNGKHTIVNQVQVVVGQSRFYTRSLNIGLEMGPPILDSNKVLPGLELFYDDPIYTYRPHDESILKMTGYYEIGPWKHEDYTAVGYGTTKVDVVEIINGKEKVLDTFTLNVLEPRLRAWSENITIKQSRVRAIWNFFSFDYDYIVDEIIFESENPSIIDRKNDIFVSTQTGTTKLHMYYKYKGKKLHLGTSNVTVIP